MSGLSKRLRRAGKADAAALHHIGMVGDAQRDMGELLDQENSDALGGERFEHRHQPRHDHGRKTEGEFVGQNLATG